MSYFSRRNQHVVEYSGHEEVSTALRARLLAILKRYVIRSSVSYNAGAPYSVEMSDFYHEIRKEFPDKDPFELIESGQFHEVFTVVEIFLDMVMDIDHNRKRKALFEIPQAFMLSGSVYTINVNRIELVIDEDLAKNLEQVKGVLSGNSTAFEKFFDTVGNLVGRKAKAEDIVKDIFVAFEDYLKDQTGAKDYGGAVDILRKKGVLSPTQKALFEKIYAYRSDSYGVGHAGNSGKPEEIDALWFVETVTAQLLFVDRKLKKEKV